MKRTISRGIAALAGAAMLAFAALPAAAQQAGEDAQELQAEYDALFEQMFADPANLDVTFRFAEVAIGLGNFESAISALERMLLFNPDLPRVRLELGVLYFRLGSFALARSYLTRAAAAEDAPAEVKARVEVFLAEIEKRLSPHQFSGSIYSGLRWQSNANSGPSSTAVRAASVDAVLDSQFARQSDSNVFVSGNVKHLFDTQNQAGTVWETNAFFYATEQTDEDQIDLFLLAVDPGHGRRSLRTWFPAPGSAPTRRPIRSGSARPTSCNPSASASPSPRRTAIPFAPRSICASACAISRAAGRTPPRRGKTGPRPSFESAAATPLPSAGRWAASVRSGSKKPRRTRTRTSSIC